MFWGGGVVDDLLGDGGVHGGHGGEGVGIFLGGGVEGCELRCLGLVRGRGRRSAVAPFWRGGGRGGLVEVLVPRFLAPFAACAAGVAAGDAAAAALDHAP